MKEIIKVEYKDEEEELKIIIVRLIKKIINIKIFIVVIIVIFKIKLKIDKNFLNL